MARVILAMIQAYLDESGRHEGANVCVIAGYFGGPGQWKKFGSDWEQILQHHNVSEFHAKEFWARDPLGERVGPYKGWSKRKADAFIDQLVNAIQQRKIHPVSCAIVLDSFNKLSHNQRRFLTGGKLVNGRFKSSGCPSKPYFLAFQTCTLDAADHAPVGGRSDFFFDLNKQFKGYARDLFALVKGLDLKVKDRIGEVHFPTGMEAVQLQAADMFCYESYQYALKKAANPNEKPHDLLLRMLKGLVGGADTFLNDEGLALLLDGIEIPPDDCVQFG